MKIAKIPQPWASLVMSEAIEYILPVEGLKQGEALLIYAVREGDGFYESAMDKDKLDKLTYNEEILGNIEKYLPTECALGWVRSADFNPRKRDVLYVTDVHQFDNHIKTNIAQIDDSILNEPCKEHNYKSIEFGYLKFPNKFQKGKYFYTDCVILPLGDDAWEKFIFEVNSIYLYWSREFIPLVSWLDSKFDKFGTTDSNINVVLRHEDKEIWCMMLNRIEVCRESLPTYYIDEETGKKTWNGTIDSLVFHFDKTLGLEIDDINGTDIINEEKKRLLSKGNEDKHKRKEWVHIIYTPMGNKR